MSEIFAEESLNGVISGGEDMVKAALSPGGLIINDYVIRLTEIEQGFRMTVTRGSEVQSMDVVAKDGVTPRFEWQGDFLAIYTDEPTPVLSPPLRGPRGLRGLQGEPGVPGDSCTAAVEEIEGGHRVTLTNKTSSPSTMPGGSITLITEETLDVMDGEDGEDGFSPEVDVEEINGGHRVTITDAEGAKAFDVMDGGDADKDMLLYEHMPRVFFAGTTDGMSKENEVILGFRYLGAKNYINDPNGSGARENGIEYSGYAKVKWQGSSSIKFPKKNYTIKLYSDAACEDKMPLTLREKWGAQNKYCMKANFIDPTHCRNIIAARFWAKCVLSRPTDCESYIRMNGLPNAGAIDGYPVLVFINNEYQGIYTMNIPKDEWMFGMTNGEGANVVLCGENYSDSTRFNGPAAIDGTDWGYEVEPADKTWVLDSFNAIYNALALPETTAGEVAAKKTALAACLDIYSVIDYFIFINKFGLTDNNAKNQIMLTYDGVHWIMSAYDLDTAFGLYWSGAKYLPATQPDKNNKLTGTIPKLFKTEYNERKTIVDSLLTKAAVSDELMNFAIDIPQEAFMQEAKIWPDMAGANMNGMNQIQDFLNYHEAADSGSNVPTPTTEDAGKFLRVDSAGAYVLEAIMNAEEVGF